MTTLNLSQSADPRLRKPWETVDEEIAPHLTMEMVFGDLRRLRRDGRYYQACCPIHEGDEQDAFSIDPERLEWICFIGCGGGGPVQFLQKSQGLTWMESAQALAVMAGVDPGKVQLWGQHWSSKDFERHEQLERRSSLLRIFVAFSRSLLMSAAGRSLRTHLQQQYGLTEAVLGQLEVGLYTTAADVFHYLKRTGQNLEELRSRGLFEPRWTGRVVVPWMDASGRIVNLWSWESGTLPKKSDQPKGEVLFNRDPLGAQQTPFLLRQAQEAGKSDLILLDEPLYALLAQGSGLRDPFPIASWGRLTHEQVDLLDRVLAEEGSLTLLSSYSPQSYGTKSDATFQNLKLLQAAEFPVYAVDSKRLAPSEDQIASPETFLRTHGGEAFRQLIKQAEVMISPEHPPAKESFLPGLSRVFGGGESFGGHAWGRGRTAQASLIGLLLGAAEEIGQRIARGFLRALPVELRPALPEAQEPSLPEESRLLPGLKPAGSAPQRFSVDRLEEQSWSDASAKASGWHALDAQGVRFRSGELIVAGGPPDHGKTSMLVGLLVYWLYSTEENFVFYSFDESEVQIYQRLLSLLTAVAGEGWTLAQVREHFENRSQPSADVTLAQVEVLENARECLRGWEERLHVVFRPGWTFHELEKHLQGLAATSTLGGVLIDSADQLFFPTTATLTPQLPVSRRLKGLAVEHTCPVLASVRLERRPIPELESLAGENWLAAEPTSGPLWADARTVQTLNQLRPTLEDFPNGLDQEADLMLGLFSYAALHPELFAEQLPPVTPFEIGLLKNRSGSSGDWLPLNFEREFCLLEN